LKITLIGSADNSGAITVEEGNEMLKRTLIAIAVVALVATSAQAFGPEPHDGTGDFGGKHQSIKVDIQKLEIGWPVEYKALTLCVIPVKMSVGYFVQVEKCSERKIKLVQVDCEGDGFGKGPGDWPCYYDCEDVKVRANFNAKLGLKLTKIGGVIKDWEAYFKDGDTVDASGSWNTITVCVKAWKAQLMKESPGMEINVGTVTITVKPQA
jgi:hypothetical protein